MILAASPVNDAIETVMSPIADAVSSVVFFDIPIGENSLPIILVWLLAGSLFFTLYLGVQQLRPHSQKLSYHLIRGRFARETDPGEVTSFQALATELSGTVGLGNIAGVAIAITVGGPGAALWIAVAGLLGMSVKMAEATLGSKFRVVREDGTTDGGPMYYLRDGLKQQGHATLGKVLSVAFAVTTIFGMTGAGNMFQANQATSQIVSVSGGVLEPYRWAIGIAIAGLVALVILGGITKTGNYTSRIVPIMAAVYVLTCLVVIGVNIEQLPAAVTAIVDGAFTGKGAAGGVFGAMIIGFRRAAFSNAAGVGTAGIAHSAVKTRRPASQGFVAMWEPFVDSVLVCSITALTVVITGVWQNPEPGVEGVALTSGAWETVAPWLSYVLAIAVALFAFSTMLSYSFYGCKAVGFLFGGSRKAEKIYNVVFILLIVVGATTSLDPIVNFSDAMLFLMAVPNLLGLYFLAPVVKQEIFGFVGRVKDGDIGPVAEEHQLGMLYSKERDEDPAVTVGNIPEGGGSMGEVPTGSEPGEFCDDFYSDEMPSADDDDVSADSGDGVVGESGERTSADSFQSSEGRVQQ